jgi:ribosomal protein S18 acetylase RimI-like enzyme
LKAVGSNSRIAAMSTSTPEELLLEPALESDIDAIAAMLNRYGRAVLNDQFTTAEALRTEWSLPGFDPAKDLRLLRRPGGQIVGAGICGNIHPPHVSSHLLVAVDPGATDDRQRDTLRLLEWTEKRAEERIADAPEGARVSRGIGVDSRDELLERLVQDRRYARVRSIIRMRGDYPEAPAVPELPAGMVFRNLLEFTDLRAVAWADEESFRDHYGHAPSTLDDAHKLLEYVFNSDPLMERHLSFVVLDGEEVAGICLNRKESDEMPEAGYVGTLGVRPAWRKRGLGLALLRRGIRALVEEGKNTVLLHVDSESLTGANRLYERAGMHHDRTLLIYEQEIRPGEEFRRME